MKRRHILQGGLLGSAAIAAGATPALAQAEERTTFILVHGSWGGAWCWGLVEPFLAAQGHTSMAIDLPGHGLNARLPESFLNRPLDPAAFATEPSFIATLGIGDYADAVLAAAARARDAGASRVILVGHSMGGVPITFAAAKDPSAVDGLAYVAAIVATPGKPGGYFLGLPEQEAGGKLGPLFMADPAITGALRFDPRSEDPAYLAAAKEALAADVDDGLLRAVTHLMTPDAPAAMFGEVPDFPDAYAAIPRAFLRCAHDNTIVPAVQDAEIADMDAAFPDNPTQVFDLDTSHVPIYSNPGAVADALVAFAG